MSLLWFKTDKEYLKSKNPIKRFSHEILAFNHNEKILKLSKPRFIVITFIEVMMCFYILFIPILSCLFPLAVLRGFFEGFVPFYRDIIVGISYFAIPVATVASLSELHDYEGKKKAAGWKSSRTNFHDRVQQTRKGLG